MGRGSPVCQQIREKIIEMFKNNVPQRKIGRDLDISPSTVHNIIKRFKESGGISVRKGQGRKPKLWARRHLGWTITQRKRVLWSDESVFQVFFGRNGRRVLRTKEEKDHPDCYQQQVQKPGSVMVWGCVSALGKGNLHFCDGTINAEKYIEINAEKYIETQYAAFKKTSFPGTSMHISTRQCKTTFCTHYKVLAVEEEGTGT